MRARPVDVIVILALSMLCVITSYKLKIDHNGFVIDSMKGTLQGHPWISEVQSRLIPPWMLSGLTSLTRHRISEVQIYKVVRVLCALVAFGTVYVCTLFRTRSPSQSLLATALCAYGYLWTTLTFFMEYPEDLLDIGFTYLLCWLCVQDLVGWLLPVILLACLNRESGAFGGLMYACLRPDFQARTRSWLQPVLLGLAMSALAFLFVTGVRWAYAGHFTHQHFGIVETLRTWRYALQPFGWLVCLAGMFMPLAILLWMARGHLVGKARRMVIAAGVILIPTCIIGIVGEIRVFLPMYAILVFALIESGLDFRFAHVGEGKPT